MVPRAVPAGGDRQRERGASGRKRYGTAPLQRCGEASRSFEQSGVRVLLGDHRQRTIAQARVEHGTAGQQDHPMRAGAQHTPGERKGAAGRILLDTNLQIGTGKNRGHRGGRTRAGGTIRQIDQAVVFVQRHRHRTSRIGGTGRLLCRGAVHRGQCRNQDHRRQAHGHSQPQFTFLIANSTMLERPSAVSSEARKTDGPMRGNVTVTGNVPMTVREASSR